MSDTQKQAIPVNTIISDNEDMILVAVIKNPVLAAKLGEKLPVIIDDETGAGKITKEDFAKIFEE